MAIKAFLDANIYFAGADSPRGGSGLILSLVKLLSIMLPQKDIPVLLGAIQSGAPYFITLDKKHFLGNERLKKLSLPFEILNPGEFIQIFFKRDVVRQGLHENITSRKKWDVGERVGVVFVEIPPYGGYYGLGSRRS